MNRVPVFWLTLVATLAVYLVIVLWSLPRISAAAGGLVPFDLRPSGYGLDEARAFLTALSETGRGWYLGTQHRLDLAFPLLLALSFVLGFTLVFRGPLLWLSIAVALGAMACDLMENHAVAGLLRTDPAALDAAAVAAASRWSVGKAALTTVAGIALLVGAALALARRLGHRGR
jgi:hypothetical protein